MRYRFHPSKRPIIKGLQEAAKQFPKMPNTANNSDSKSSVVLHPDGFGNLPIEIRLQIATYLPTVDFLSLRQSSRAMVVIFEFQSFWKSRFSVNGDRGVLNCLLTDPRKHESRDWRLIYRCTANIDRSHEHLWAAQRRWRNNRWLRERYSMIRASNEQIFSNLGLFDELCRKEVSSGLRCDRDGLKLKKMEELSHVPEKAYPLFSSSSVRQLYRRLRCVYHTRGNRDLCCWFGPAEYRSQKTKPDSWVSATGAIRDNQSLW